jgi:hypothetical protein
MLRRISNRGYEQPALQCFCGWIKCSGKCAITVVFAQGRGRPNLIYQVDAKARKSGELMVRCSIYAT